MTSPSHTSGWKHAAGAKPAFGRGFVGRCKSWLIGALRPERTFEPPVAWLFGRQLIGSLKGTLLHIAFGSKLDPREWMQAQIHVFDDEDYRDKGEFWFDYISDTGDGMKATYSIAYLCLSDLWTKLDKPYAPDFKLDAKIGDIRLHEGTTEYKTRLPRGEFLFVGGDTTYHLSDYESLATRFQRPFKWACDDLKNHLRKKGLQFDETRRPLFGIPGNHDYYDQLDGFRRQFRRPIRSEDMEYSPEETASAPQLMLSGFRRCQEASYVALKLPFDWWLWGLDTEVGQLDERQRSFFEGIKEKLYLDETTRGQLSAEEGTPSKKDDLPRKLIVATPAPTTVFGKLADKDDGKSAQAFAQLKLPQPFLPDFHKLKPGADGKDLSPVSGDIKLEDGQCRLDLSGDVHQYARYWGPPTKKSKPRSAHARASAPEADSYASVVSGLGGAFHHPSLTYVDEVQEQALYPSEKSSREEVAKHIFNFVKVLRGGSVHLIGFTLAFVIYFAATVPPSSKQFVSNFPLLFELGITQPAAIEPTIGSFPGMTSLSKTAAEIQSASAGKPVTRFWLWQRLGVWIPPIPMPARGANCNDNTPRYFYGRCGIKSPVDYKVGSWLLISSLLALVIAYLSFPSGKHSWETQVNGEREIRISSEDREFRSNPGKQFGVLLFGIVSAALAFLGIASIQPYRIYITPFGNSMLVLFTILWASAAAALSVRYSEWLFKQAAKRYLGLRDWMLPWVLSVLSIVGVASTLR